MVYCLFGFGFLANSVVCIVLFCVMSPFVFIYFWCLILYNDLVVVFAVWVVFCCLFCVLIVIVGCLCT